MNQQILLLRRVHLAGSGAVRLDRGAEVRALRAAAQVEPWNVEREGSGRSQASRVLFMLSSVGARPTVTFLSSSLRCHRHNHSVHREWCEVCVAARGAGAQHRHRRRKGPVDQEQRGQKEILKNWSNCSDSTLEQTGDRMLSEILCEVHGESRHQEIHQLQRQPTINIGTRRCSGTITTL